MKDDTNRIKTLEKEALKFNCFREYLSQIYCVTYLVFEVQAKTLTLQSNVRYFRDSQIGGYDEVIMRIIRSIFVRFRQRSTTYRLKPSTSLLSFHVEHAVWRQQ